MRIELEKAILKLPPKTAIWVGIVFALAFWVVDSEIDAFFFNNYSYLENLQPTGMELYMRLVVCFYIIAAGYLISRIVHRQLRIERLKGAERFHKVIDISQDGFWISDRSGRLIEVNNAYCRKSGYRREELLNKTVTDLGILVDPEESKRHFEAIVSKGAGIFEMQHRTRDGRILDLEASVHYSNESGGQFYSFLRNITDRKQNEQALSRFKAIVDSTDVAIISKTLEGIIVSWNPGAENLFGYSAEEVIGQTMKIMIPPDLLDEEQEILARIGRGQKVQHFETVRRRKDGRLVDIYVTISPIIGFNGKVVGVSKIARDISERKQAEKKIKELAFYDTLTHLPNRRLLHDRINQAMAASKRSSCYGTLMFLDLDNFKPLNDKYGHGVGDLLLAEAARRITENVRQMDTVARFGGDEFVVLINELDKNRAESAMQAGTVAEKIREVLAEPYKLAVALPEKTETMVEHRCTASIGVVLFLGFEFTQDDIIKWADQAMYQAKAGGRNSIHFYNL